MTNGESPQWLVEFEHLSNPIEPGTKGYLQLTLQNLTEGEMQVSKALLSVDWLKPESAYQKPAHSKLPNIEKYPFCS